MKHWSGACSGVKDKKRTTPLMLLLASMAGIAHCPTMPGAPELNRVFREGLAALNACEPFEKGMAFFLFGALQEFFFDGNKRTSRFMMNGVLMSNGIDAISVPAARAQAFNEKMVRFYLTKDATEMMSFLVDCHPEATDPGLGVSAPENPDDDRTDDSSAGPAP